VGQMGIHPCGGWVSRVIPGSAGLQCFGFDLEKKIWEKDDLKYDKVTGYLWDFDGRLIKEVDEKWVRSFPLDWDGDGVKEICLEEGAIVNYENKRVDEFNGNPLWAGDIYGDHREELIFTKEGRKVYILFNVNQTEYRARYAPIEDRMYRNDLSRTAMQFNVIPTIGGYNYTMDRKND
jgi:hypothetical protein